MNEAAGNAPAPHRGVLVLILGVLSVALLGPILGIPAWILGHKDLKKIKAGEMDSEGKTMTLIGYILGIVSTVLGIIGIVTAIAIPLMIGVAGDAISDDFDRATQKMLDEME